LDCDTQKEWKQFRQPKYPTLFKEIVGTESDAAIKVYLKPTLVAMVTKIWDKFNTKLAIIWLM